MFSLNAFFQIIYFRILLQIFGNSVKIMAAEFLTQVAASFVLSGLLYKRVNSATFLSKLLSLNYESLFPIKIQKMQILVCVDNDNVVFISGSICRFFKNFSVRYVVIIWSSAKGLV